MQVILVKFYFSRQTIFKENNYGQKFSNYWYLIIYYVEQIFDPNYDLILGSWSQLLRVLNISFVWVNGIQTDVREILKEQILADLPQS